MTRAITHGDLSIVTSDGTTLTDTTDLGLAWKWAEHENGEAWARMRYTQRHADVADALAALRTAYHEGA
jgi:hypothetical protein